MSPVSVPRKSQRKRVKSFIVADVIKSFSDINEGICPSGYLFQKYDDRVVFIKLSKSDILTPEVTGCIQVDSKLHVKIFKKECSVYLPQWFSQGQNCCISKESRFAVYLEYYVENISPIIDKF